MSSEVIRINSLWYRMVRFLARNVGVRALGGVRVIGRENVPTSGPLLLTPNHVSYLDPPLLGSIAPRILCYMAKEELFKNKIFGAFLKSVGVFPVRRGQNDIGAIRRAIEILGQGHALVMFPEGMRGDGKILNPINPGVAMLAKRTNARVLPVGIIGTHLVWPRSTKKIRRAKMTVIFGQPFLYEEVAHGNTEHEKRELFSYELSQRIIDLCKQGGLELQLSPKQSSFTENSGYPGPDVG